MSKEEKNKIVPKLRFPEFENSGGWVEKILSQVANYENGKAHEQDIVEKGKFVVVNSKFISTDGEIKKFTNTAFCLAQTGDILMVLSDVPNGKAIAKCFFVNTDNLYSVNQRICKITPFAANNIFLLFILNRSPYFLSFDDGVKQTNLRNEDVLNFPFLSPIDIKEQQKIADCLSSLDELITAQSQKLQALKAHKKGLMQQLFPAEGETVPQLRFAEFRESVEWEEKTLKHAGRMQAGKFVSASEINEKMNDGLFPCYGGNGLRGYTKSFTHTGKYSLIGRQGALCGNINLAEGKFHATEHAVVVTPEQGVDTGWLFYLLTHLNLNQYATGQAQPGLSVDNLEKVEIKIPKSEKEQQKIVDCLSSLDELITAQAEKIEALKAHKKGLMQGLFPSSEL